MAEASAVELSVQSKNEYAQYIPTAIPVLQAFAAVPAVQGPAGISPQVWGIIANTNSFTVRQQVKLLPKACISCPPCVEQENTYAVYAGMGESPAAQVFRADEISNDWNRCCCAPEHPLKVEIRQYLPTGQELNGSSPAYNDIVNDFARLSGSERVKKEKELYQNVPVALTMVRDGTQFPACCNKAVGCCVCTDCCADGFHLVSGPTNEADTKQIGSELIAMLDSNAVIGTATVPVPWGGVFSPTLNVMERDAASPFAKVQGPFIFGGWSEFCCDFNFPVSRFEGPDKIGDIAKIVKRKPNTLEKAAVELFTESDVFTIEFNPEAKLTPEQKSLLLSSLLLNDYTYFEKAGDKCGSTDDGGCYVNLWNCYCCGCVCPCKLEYHPSQQ